LRGGEVEFVPSALVARTFADAARGDVVRLELHVEATAAAAHAQLLGWLASSSNPEPVPAARSLGIAVGDAAFVGLGGAAGAAPRWLAFVRGNLALRLSCLLPDGPAQPDLGALARAVDVACLRSKAVADGVEVPRPRIARFAAGRSACLAGEAVPLALELVDPAAGTPTIHWIVGGTDQGQGYVQPAGDGSFTLLSTGRGPLTVTACVVGSTGTVANASVAIRVD
jgi:hypothetical protein